jgi:hypothetical protein
VHRPGRCRVRELGDSIGDATPNRDTVVIIGGGEFVGAREAFRLGLLAVALQHQVGGPPDVDFRYHAAKSVEERLEGSRMPPILTAEDVVKRVAAECTFIDVRGGVGIRLKPAAAIVREYGEQFRAAHRRKRQQPKPPPPL